MRGDKTGLGWLLASLALQNLGRRRGRTLLLVLAVAVGSGVVFTGAALMRSIEASVSVGFARLGADLMVVPEAALTNITAALLTVEPGDLTLDRALLDGGGIQGIRRSAPQRVFRAAHSGIGNHHETVDLIGFDPARDFTVLPWLDQRLPGTLQPGDIILGARRDLPLGSEVRIFGQPHRVYGKLGRSGVGTHELGIFMTEETLLALAPALHGGVPPMLRPDRVSGFLIELAPGATELQLRFALLSQFEDIKVVSGESLLSSIRQGLAALLDGLLALIAMTFAGTAVMVCLLFSAIVAERRQELGLLKAIGARRRQVIGMLLTEAAIATGAGGLLGVMLGLLLMRLFERLLVFHLQAFGLPFVWLDWPSLALLAGGCVLLAAATGALGVLYPAARAGRRDAYDLIRGTR